MEDKDEKEVEEDEDINELQSEREAPRSKLRGKGKNTKKNKNNKTQARNQETCVSCAHGGLSKECVRDRKVKSCKPCLQGKRPCSFLRGTVCIVTALTRRLIYVAEDVATPDDLSLPAFVKQLNDNSRVVVDLLHQVLTSRQALDSRLFHMDRRLHAIVSALKDHGLQVPHADVSSKPSRYFENRAPSDSDVEDGAPAPLTVDHTGDEIPGPLPVAPVLEESHCPDKIHVLPLDVSPDHPDMEQHPRASTTSDPAHVPHLSSQPGHMVHSPSPPLRSAIRATPDTRGGHPVPSDTPRREVLASEGLAASHGSHNSHHISGAPSPSHRPIAADNAHARRSHRSHSRSTDDLSRGYRREWSPEIDHPPFDVHSRHTLDSPHSSEDVEQYLARERERLLGGGGTSSRHPLPPVRQWSPDTSPVYDSHGHAYHGYRDTDSGPWGYYGGHSLDTSHRSNVYTHPQWRASQWAGYSRSSGRNALDRPLPSYDARPSSSWERGRQHYDVRASSGWETHPADYEAGRGHPPPSPRMATSRSSGSRRPPPYTMSPLPSHCHDPTEPVVSTTRGSRSREAPVSTTTRVSFSPSIIISAHIVLLECRCAAVHRLLNVPQSDDGLGATHLWVPRKYRGTYMLLVHHGIY